MSADVFVPGYTTDLVDAYRLLTPTPVKTSNYSAAVGELVRVDASAASRTVTLPSGASVKDKAVVCVKQVAVSGQFATTVNCSGSDHFNTTTGATSATLSLRAQALLVQYNASDRTWSVISDDLPLSQLDTRFGFGINPKTRGAAGDWVSSGSPGTDDTAAVNAAIADAAAAGVPLSPTGGFYRTSLVAGSTLNGPIWGSGQIVDNAGNKRGKIFNVLTSQPTSLKFRPDGAPYTSSSTIEEAFSGDQSHVPISIEHRIIGADTLGSAAQTASGYFEAAEASPFLGFLYSESGRSGAGSSGRTGVGFMHLRLRQSATAGGDMTGVWVDGVASGITAGATRWDQNSSIGVINGELIADADGVYLDNFETQIKDGYNGGPYHDVTAIGLVANFYRRNDTGALGALWNGIRLQSVGTKSVDVGYMLWGAFTIGIDLSAANLGALQGAIALKQGQRVYFDASGTDSGGLGFYRYPDSLGNAWIEGTALSGGRIDTIVGGTRVLQVSSTQVTANGSFQSTGLASLAALAVAGATTLSAALNMTSHRINNVADPASLQDVATKNYVDTSTTVALTDAGLKTADYTASANQIVRCDTTSGSLTVTLPNAPAVGTRVVVKHTVQGGTNTVTVACQGADVLNTSGGATTRPQPINSDTATYQYIAGGIWVVLATGQSVASLDLRYRLASAAITNSDLATMAAKTIKGRHTNSTGAPEDVSMANLWSDLSGQAAADVSMNSHKLTSVADPGSAQDAATKNYVDVSLADPLAVAAGYVNWVWNPMAANNQTTATSQQIYAHAVWLPAGAVITGITLGVSTAGSGTTPAHFYVGIADSTGQMKAQSNNLNSSAALTTVGIGQFALSGTYTVPSSGMYFLVFLQDGAFGSTAVKFLLGSQVGTSAGAALTGKKRLSGGVAGQTALPANASYLGGAADSLTAINNQYWVGAY